MSLFTDASLVYVPSGVKDGKTYSITPTDGSGDLTFSRGSDIEATRIGADGYIHKAVVNYMLYSQDFTNAQWVAFNSTKTTGQTDPNGGTTAVKIDSTAVANSGLYVLDITNFGSNRIRTASIWMKGEAGGEVVEYGDATNRATATLTTSWVRYSFAATDASAFFVIYNQTSAPVVQTWYVAFAQYEDGLVAKEYQPTTSAVVVSGITDNMPRLNYDPANPTCPSLLLEPSRTNVLPQSEYYGGSEWTKTNTAVTTNATTSPEGVQNASLVYPTASSSTKWGVMLQEFLSIPSGSYTNTFYLKSNGWRWVYLIDPSGAKNVWFDLQEGVVGTQEANATGEIQAMGDGWYKCVVTPHTTPTTYTYAGLFFSDADNSYVCTASGTNGVYVYGAQSEAGSYPTSYIPTYGSSATRLQDSAENTSASSIIGQTEGTIFAQVGDFPKEFNGRIIAITQDSNNYITILKNGNYNDFYTLCAVGGASQMSYQGTGSLSDNAKIAVAYANNDFVVYVNGTQVHTDTSASVPTCSNLFIGKRENGTVTYSTGGSVSQALLFPNRLSNADLATLTSL